MMEQRDPLLELCKIKLKYVRFFWTPCKLCGNEFRKTNMWFYINPYPKNGQYFKYSVCCDCIQNYDKLVDYIFRKPTSPNAPPQRPKGHLITDGGKEINIV